MTTLTNSFHGTTVRTQLTRAQMDEIEYLYYGTVEDKLSIGPQDMRTVRRIKRALCGVSGCSCGNFWGERG